MTNLNLITYLSLLPFLSIQNLPDWKLLVFVCFFVFLDIIIMSLWITIGDVHVEETMLAAEVE